MSPTSRALRVGIVLGGQLVEERLFRTDGLPPVTLGQSLRCTLSVPADGVPSEHLLFSLDHGHLVLHVAERMTGRLVRDGTTTELVGGQAHALDPGVRGRLRLGDATILFQELAAPPVTPRIQLPASVRGTLSDRIDPRLAAIVGGSLALHLALAIVAWTTEREEPPTFDDDVAAYEAPRYEIVDVDAPDLEAPAPDPAPGPSAPGVAAPARPAVQTPRPGQVHVEPVSADRWANMLTGNEPGRDGRAEMPSRVPATALDQQIRHLRDTGANVVPARTSRDHQLRLGDGVPAPTIRLPGEIGNQPKQERPPVARITPVPMPRPPDPPTLTINMVLARIQGSYMAGLQRCYVKHGLARDATLVAKVTLAFTVDDHGATVDTTARGGTSEVDACILGQMSSWQFPVPKDRDGDPTDASFKLVLALQPS